MKSRSIAAIDGRRYRTLLAGAVLAAVASQPVAASAGSIEGRFLASCRDRERPELQATASWPWIDLLCHREAALRAGRFEAASEPDRIVILADACRDWHLRNLWRFSSRVTGDVQRWQAMVEARCTAEAKAELESLQAGPPPAAAAATPPPTEGGAAETNVLAGQ